MFTACNECPGRAPEMLVEGHFRSISVFVLRVDFEQHEPRLYAALGMLANVFSQN